MKWTVGTKIGAGFGLALVVIVIIGTVSYWSTNKLTETATWVARTHQVYAGLEEVYSLMKDAQRGERGYIITGEERYLEPFTSALAGVDRQLPELRRLIVDPEQLRRLQILEPQVQAELDELKKAIEIRRAQGLEAAVQEVRTGTGKKAMDDIRKTVIELQDAENELLKKRKEQAQSAVTFAHSTIVFGTALSFIVLALTAFAISRNIARPLKAISGIATRIAVGDLNVNVSTDGRSDEVGVLARTFKKMVERLSSLIGQVQKSGIQVTTSSTEIAAAAKQQQTTANEISSTTTEISATAKEISATAKELVKTMQDVAKVAEDAATLAGSGQSGLARMETTMRQIMEASGPINARLAVLNEKAGNINTVVTTIAKVADQTNLLSLNAAIEAEKAGEYGRGFAVVATEIRRLADQTAVATSDIEQMVKEMQSAVSAGVMGMDKFSEEVRRGVEVVGQVSTQLAQIIERVQTLTPNFETVNEGMQSQAVGAQQISEALAQLSEASQQTVESLRQSNEAIAQLTEVTSGLQGAVSRFKMEG